ncbi:MAG: hypothetical protein ACXWL2_00735 [Candidatus Chromulinivorax sp.]
MIRFFFPQIIIMLLFGLSQNLDATIKIFVNNSSKNLFIRLFDSQNNVVAVNLEPGQIEEVFLQAQVIDKIIIQDKKSETRPLASMIQEILKKETSKINNHTTFIINKDLSVKMYAPKNSKSEFLEKIDKAFTTKEPLPSIQISIKSTKTEKPWVLQNVEYKIKDKNLLESIGSLFS